MPRSKPKKDRTSLLISVGLHVVLIGAVVYWAYKTGQIEKIRQVMLQYVKGEKKEEEKPKPVQQRQAEPPKLPPINQGLPPPSSGGTRRAVMSDAPEASGGTSFFQDTRKQVQGPSTSGSGPAPIALAPKVALPDPPASRPAFAPPPKTTIKELFIERAKEAAATEAFGTEQISKTGVSDAGAIINKVSGASVVDGKFAVIRGLSDRYVTTTLNGAEIPSADPYRRSASLDLFPAQIINKVVVAKTFTPDQQGAYTGGGINIVTKSFPEKPFLSMSLGTAYNTRATLNGNFLTYEGGALDWAGTDDGTRALPPALADRNLVVPNPPFSTGARTLPTYNQRIAEAETLQSLTRQMGVAQFGAARETAPFDHNFSIAVGDTTHMFGRPLGVFGGLSYKREFRFFDDGISRRYAPGAGPGNFVIRNDYRDARAVDQVNWSGVVNLAYQVFPDHELGFNFLYNQNGEDLARQQVGTSQDDPGSIFHLNRLHFTERNLQTYQLKGTHRVPDAADIKLDWLAAISKTTQEEPDTRFFNYVEEGGSFQVGKASVPDPKNPTRYFRTLDENNRNLKADLTVPFRQWSWREGEFKIGAFDSVSDRSFVDREVYYQGDAPFSGNPNQFLTPDNLGFTSTTNQSNGRINYSWSRYLQTRDSVYDADSTIQAAYAMLDFPLVDKVRLIGGVRYETTDLGVGSRSYLANSVTGQTANESSLSQGNLLPSAGLVWSPRTNMNVRLSYSQTIARPSFRELAGYRSYDPVLDTLLDGNPRLKMSSIDNYDLRWEWFPRPGELIGVSFFYKKLQNAIERLYLTTDAEIISFANRENADVLGIEFEVRKSLDFIDPLLREFSLGGNLSLIQSEVALTPEELKAKRDALPGAKSTRSLYDQSPYILNLDLSYDNPYSGTSVTLVYNIAGPRITIASLNTDDVFEQPAGTLDLIVSQKLTRRSTVKFTAKNLLDPRIERTYGEKGGLLYSSFQRGMTFGMSLNMEF